MDKFLELYNLPIEKLLKEAQKYTSDKVEFCSLISAKTGRCGENCKYCAQSSHYFTEVQTHPLVEVEEVIKCAKEAQKSGATRFAIVTSGKRPEDKDFLIMLEMIKAINKVEGLSSCASLGIINEEQTKMLKEAGLGRFHHNINTAKSYHKSVCTTHSYKERIDTINLVKKYNMELCSGVIIGMGESAEQRIEMAVDLSKIEPDSIPVNFLTPIEGTPFENHENKIDEENILRTLAIFKIANPKAIIRFAGGQLRLSEKNRELALKYCVEGLIAGNYLTTTGVTPEEDRKTIEKIGKEVYV